MMKRFEQAKRILEELLSRGELDAPTVESVTAAARALGEGLDAAGRSAEEADHAGGDGAESEQGKVDFLSRMSHEIKTPISVILGMARVAQKDWDEEKVRECLRVIESSGQRLLRLVNDARDISDMTEQSIQIAHEPFNFESMLMALVYDFSLEADQKKQKLYCDIDVGMPTQYMGDERRLSQVISHLVGNAMKFTPVGGSIAVTARQIGREGDQSVIEVKVSDDGIGICRKDQADLFKPFYQTDRGNARLFEGVGLGLTLCKQLVWMMGGEIDVTSDEGRGSTFRFTATLTALDEGSAEKARKDQHVHGINAIIVDPDEETQRYFCKVMDSFRMRGLSAGSMEEAMRLVERGRKALEPVSILYLDWGLARTNGVSMAKTLGSQYSIKTVAMVPTAQMPEDLIGAREDTAMHYIAKPLLPSALLKSIYEVSGADIFLQKSGARRNSFIGYHVLLAEDVEINRHIFGQIMQDAQVSVSYAENGAIAVEMFQKDPDLYDMILMDVHMPVMDGYEATRYIRSMTGGRGASVPIVALTANAFARDGELSRQAGMNGHLTKPIEAEKVFELMKTLLKPEGRPQNTERRKDAALRETQREEQIRKTLRASSYIDYTDALGRVRGSVRVLMILLQSFASNNRWKQLRAEIVARDYEAAVRSAAELRSLCANLSMRPLQEKIEEIEMQIQSRFHIDETLSEADVLFEHTLESIRMADKEISPASGR